MHDEKLKMLFSPLENCGFSLQGDACEAPFVYLGEHHKIRTQLLDYGCNLECEITLITCPKAWVDGYSIVAWYDRSLLEHFLAQPNVLHDEDCARFLVESLVGKCSNVFERTSPAGWMELLLFHRNSLRKRNQAFRERLTSGLNSVPGAEYMPLNEMPTF